MHAKRGLSRHCARLLAGLALMVWLLPPAKTAPSPLTGRTLLLSALLCAFFLLVVAGPLLGTLTGVFVALGALSAPSLAGGAITVLLALRYRAGTRYFDISGEHWA